MSTDLSNIIHDQMGKNGFVWFHGVVEDVNDPLLMGRIRVRCFGFHTGDKLEIPTEDLPWATVLQPITSAAVSGKGTSPTGVLTGAWVVGFFRDGINCQDPIVMGTFAAFPEQNKETGQMSDPERGFNDPEGQYPSETYSGEPDTNRLARNQNIERTIIQEKKDGIEEYVSPALSRLDTHEWSEPETKYDAKYPKNHVTESESGHIFEVDDTPGAERLSTYHKAGTWFEIHPDGKKVEKIVSDNYEIILGDNNIKIYGRSNINTGDNLRVKTGSNFMGETVGDASVVVGEDLAIEVHGRASLQIHGDLNIETEGDVVHRVTGSYSVHTQGDVVHRVGGKYKVHSLGGMEFVAPRIDFNPMGAVSEAPEETQWINLLQEQNASLLDDMFNGNVLDTATDGLSIDSLSSVASVASVASVGSITNIASSASPLSAVTTAASAAVASVPLSSITDAAQLGSVRSMTDTLTSGAGGIAAAASGVVSGSDPFTNIISSVQSVIAPIQSAVGGVLGGIGTSLGGAIGGIGLDSIGAGIGPLDMGSLMKVGSGLLGGLGSTSLPIGSDIGGIGGMQVGIAGLANQGTDIGAMISTATQASSAGSGLVSGQMFSSLTEVNGGVY